MRHQPLSRTELVTLSKLVPRLQASVALVLEGQTSTRRKKIAAPRLARRAEPATGEKLQAQILIALKGHKREGARLGEIVSTTGAPATSVKYHLRELRDRKKVRSVGATRQARWFAA